MRGSTTNALRRRPTKRQPPRIQQTPSSIATTFKSMDMFPKIETSSEQGSRVRTESGGCFSIIGLLIISWLVLSELYYYIFPVRCEHLMIDNMYDKKLEISFDITFHSIPCSSLGICIMDQTGEQQIHADLLNHEITKTRLDLKGNALHDNPIQEQLGIINELFKFMRMDTANEGCRINGLLHIQKVSGNFHIALGSAHEIFGKHIHQFVMSDIPRFNATHTIHKLSFGEAFKGQNLPLNGMTHTIEEEGGGVFTYNLKIIPIEYISSFGYVTHSNTYSYNYKYRHISPTSRKQTLPGIFFVYKINPYMLQISEERDSFVGFLVNLSAIAGGVFAISALLDSITFNIQMLKKAKQLILPTTQRRSEV